MTSTQTGGEKTLMRAAGDEESQAGLGAPAHMAELTDSAPVSGTTASSQDEYTGHHHYIFKRLRRKMPPPTPRRIMIITAALCLSMMLCGWNDGSTGPIIPSLQEYYNVNYLKISILFICSFVGSLIGGLSNVWITDRIGFGLVVPLGALSNTICYLLAGTGGPFPLFLISYIFNGFGLSVQDAQVNNLTTRLPGAATKMSLVQAAYSLGGTFAPFIATAFAQHVKQAYRYFFVAMGIAIFAIVMMLFAFEGKTEEQIVGQLDITDGGRDGKASTPAKIKAEVVDEEKDRTIVAPTEAILPPADAETFSPHQADSSGRKMLRILSTPAVWVLMLWAFIYVGIEVALAGWMTSFLIAERGATLAAGYVVTGFWGGMTVGRIILIPASKYLGFQVSIYTYAIIALGLELVIWFTKSLPGNGVCFAFVGFFLGPIYPNALMVVSEVLDDDLRGGVMGLMGSMGGAGAAALPFMTGGISDKYGIWTIQPIAVAMIAAFTILWALVPRKRIQSKMDKGSA